MNSLHPPRTKRPATIAAAIAALAISCGVASAVSDVTVTINSPNQTAQRGDIVTYSGSIHNNTSSIVYLNGDAIALALAGSPIYAVGSDLYLDDSPYAKATDNITLAPNATWSGNLFKITVGLDAPFQTFAGTFTAQGGTGTATNQPASAILFNAEGVGNFQLQVLPPPVTSGPAAPTNLTVQVPTINAAVLNWNANAYNEDGYTVEASSDGGAHYYQIALLPPASATYTASGLQLGTLYSFRVRAFNSYNGGTNSAYSNVVTAQMRQQPASINASGGFSGAFGPSGSLVSNGVAVSNGTVVLTDGNVNEANSFFTKLTQNIQRFTTTFTFQLTNANAEGFTFCIQPVSATSIGTGGAGLGSAGLAKSVAIAFQLYDDTNTVSLNATGLYSNGATPSSGGSISLAGTGIDLHSGDSFQATLTYAAGTLTETILDLTTHASVTESYPVNIPAVVGGPIAWVGFTGSTGASLAATQQIQTWTFTPLPVAPPPAPSLLTATAVSSSEIDLAWHINSYNETNLVIQQSTNGYFFQTIATVPAGTTTYKATGLNALTTYTYRLYASNGTGDSGFTSLVSATTLAAGHVVTAITSNSSTGTVSSDVSSDPSGLMNYAVAGGSATTPATKTDIESINGTNYLTLSFVRSHPAPQGITYYIESTDNLTTGIWSPAVMLPGYPKDNGNGTETVKARDTQPAVTGTDRFMRLRTTQP